jgi:hypothetical protein
MDEMITKLLADGYEVTFSACPEGILVDADDHAAGNVTAIVDTPLGALEAAVESLAEEK